MEPAGDQLDDPVDLTCQLKGVWPQWSQPETSWMTNGMQVQTTPPNMPQWSQPETSWMTSGP